MADRVVVRQAEWSSRRTGKSLVNLETYKTNWHRETGNTGINTLGKIRVKKRVNSTFPE